MQRSQQRENTRLNRQAFIEEMNRQHCCPLSFCQSLEHNCLQDCDHPDKSQFATSFHNTIIQICSQYCSLITDLVSYNVDEFLADLQRYEFSEDKITDEQLDILMFHLHIPVMTYWYVTVRQEKIRIIMEKYNALLYDIHQDNLRRNERQERYLPPINLFPEIDIQEMIQSPLENDPLISPNSHRYNYFYSDENPLFHSIESSPFTPFRIEDAQSGNPISHITSNEVGFLNENWCNKPIQVIYDESKNEFLCSLTGEEMECPICYDKECFILTQCGHVYCECFITYVSTIPIEKDVNCPCCRSAISNVEFTHKKSYRITKALVSQQPHSSRFQFAGEKPPKTTQCHIIEQEPMSEP